MTSVRLGLGLCTILGVTIVIGQTKLNLQSQSRNVDFSAATLTRPAQTGTALPVNCLTGEIYFLTGAPAGKNLYLCSATNQWAPIVSEATVEGGLGIDAQLTSSGPRLTIDTAIVPTYLKSEPVTLDFDPIAAGTCAELPLSLLGSALSDPVMGGFPPTLEAGLTGMMRVSQPGQILVRLCNPTATEIDPVAGSYEALIVRPIYQ